MNTLSDALPNAAPEARTRAPAGPSHVRPLYWLLRRELWENRSLYIAPLIVAALILFGFLIGAAHIPHHFPRHIGSNYIDQTGQSAIADIPYSVAAVAIILTGFIVGAFYCLGALHNERRDRSILFWKSMPVSDLATVASKAAVPLLVLPVVLFVVIMATQLVLFVVDSLILAPAGVPMAALWAQWPFLPMLAVLAYGLITAAIWYAPIWGWLLMVSAWARRAPFLWAVLPPLAVCLVELLAFGTGYFGRMLTYRLGGAIDAAFSNAPKGAVTVAFAQIDPVRFLTSVDMWLGLVVAAVFLAAAVWLRHSRDLT
ncbi:MAG: hypothetical protein ACREEB_06455 [Caulobacteraceae bacterium]